MGIKPTSSLLGFLNGSECATRVEETAIEPVVEIPAEDKPIEAPPETTLSPTTEVFVIEPEKKSRSVWKKGEQDKPKDDIKDIEIWHPEFSEEEAGGALKRMSDHICDVIDDLVYEDPEKRPISRLREAVLSCHKRSVSGKLSQRNAAFRSFKGFVVDFFKISKQLEAGGQFGDRIGNGLHSIADMIAGLDLKKDQFDTSVTEAEFEEEQG